MAHTAALHLTVHTGTAEATTLAPRVQAAVQDRLTAAGVDVSGLAAAVAVGVMAEVLRVRQATPAEAALARVRGLHAEEYGLCRECTSVHAVLWPCPTVQALDGEGRPGA